MSITARKSLSSTSKCEGMVELRRGPWALEEDTLLVHCIACHGEGRWNLLARSSGLKRTGKSCRLRWLNYLKPDIKRGNLSLEEQLLILDLHSKWGNRWSRIAQHLPGRTDNEIKNYCRTTRVQRQARQLKADAHMRSCWAQNFSRIPPPRVFDEMPPGASDEFSGVTSIIDPFAISSGGGHCSVVKVKGESFACSVPVDPSRSQYGGGKPRVTTSHKCKWSRHERRICSGVPRFDLISHVVSSHVLTIAPPRRDGGHCSVNNAYEGNPWNLAPTSASTPTCFASEHTSCSKNDVTDHSSWSMDELSDMLKSYMTGSSI